MKLSDFVSLEDLREDLSDNTGDPSIDFPDEKDINEELQEALESYISFIKDSLKDNSVGLSIESLKAINIGITYIKNKHFTDSLESISIEEDKSPYVMTLEALDCVSKLKESIK